MPARSRRSTTTSASRRDDARSQPAFYNNISISGGPAPVRAYIEELPDILEGRIEPGRVFDRVIGLDDVPDGYRAMNDREAIKVW
jgi:threonine dehydrogenase-like Zn-dependent dehydrogenase